MKQARPRIGISARALAALAACTIALALPAVAQARPGDLDRTFSGDGRVTTQFYPRSRADAGMVAVQRNGRIVAVGQTTGGELALVRYLPDGSLDPSFGDGGRVRGTDLGDDFGFLAVTYGVVAIDPAGRIVVAGSSQRQGGSRVRTVVARFTPSGELDGSFAVDGVRRIDRVSWGAADLELERDGSIIVAGSDHGPDTGWDFAAIKLTPEGNLRQAFGNVGVKVIHTARPDFAYGVDVDRRGRITVGGRTNDHASFARLTPSGRLDRSFSGNGRKILKKLSGVDRSEIAVRPGGAIIATGTTRIYRGGRYGIDMFVAKLRSDGSMSRKFGRRGTRTIDTGRLDSANDLALQADGKIVIAGAGGAGGGRFAVLRLKRNGRLDRTFSRNGQTLTRFPSERRNCRCSAAALTLQPNGRIIAAGSMARDYQDESRFALARYKNDGRPAGR